MGRREFVTLLGGAAAAWPLAARAQQGAQASKIGILYPGPRQSVISRIEALLLGLRSVGYGASSQVELLVRTAEGDPARIAPLAMEIIDSRVDVLFPIGQAAVQAVRTKRLLSHTISIRIRLAAVLSPAFRAQAAISRGSSSRSRASQQNGWKCCVRPFPTLLESPFYGIRPPAGPRWTLSSKLPDN